VTSYPHLRPLARSRLAWLSPEQGGRRSGIPPGPDYAATMRLAEPAEPTPDLSVIVRYLDAPPGVAGQEFDAHLCFLAPEHAAAVLAVGTRIEVCEGPRAVAAGVVTALLGDAGGSNSGELG